MVALVASSPILFRREQRAKARASVALRAWVNEPLGAARGYALDVSESGCRIGGIGMRLLVGSEVVVKIELFPHEAPFCAKAIVARYQPVAGIGCADTCLRFTDVALDEWFRLARHVDRARARAV